MATLKPGENAQAMNDVARGVWASRGAWWLMIACVSATGCEKTRPQQAAPKEPSPTPSAQPMPPPAVEPIQPPTMPGLKRDWRGITLGSTVDDVRQAASAIDFSLKCEKQSKSTVPRYNPDNPGWTTAPPKIPVMSCGLQHKLRARLLKAKKDSDESRMITLASADFIHGKLYHLELYVPNSEPYAGLALKMESIFGQPSFKGKIGERVRMPLGISESRYSGEVWVDPNTAVLVYEVGTFDASPFVRYFDMSMMADIADEDRKDAIEREAEKQQQKSKNDF